MIELASLVFGLGFSILVYVLSIRPLDLPLSRKFSTTLFTFIGITGTLFLAGILIAHFLRKWGYLAAR